MSSQYSDELINAFVDGELDGQEKDRFRKAMTEDKQLADRVNALCELKQSVQLSYSDMPGVVDASLSSADSKVKQYFQYATAASLLLVLGVLFGWISHGYLDHGSKISNAAETPQTVKTTPAALQQASKIILHISSSEPEKLKATLDKLENILGEYQQNQLPYEVEVIANAGGIDLLRKDVSPYVSKIESIMQTNQNVSFIACRNSVDRLKLRGIKPDLIDNTKLGVTAVDQIVKRLQQGWSYVKV